MLVHTAIKSFFTEIRRLGMAEHYVLLISKNDSVMFCDKFDNNFVFWNQLIHKLWVIQLRGVTVSSVVNHLHIANEFVGSYQAGSIDGHSIADQIFSVRQTSRNAVSCVRSLRTICSSILKRHATVLTFRAVFFKLFWLSPLETNFLV